MCVSCADKALNNENKQTKCNAETCEKEAKPAQAQADSETRKGNDALESHWIEHTGNDCPVSDEEVILIVRGNGWENENGYPAGEYTWGKCLQGSITHWRYK